MEMMNVIYAVSDLHGCYDKYIKLLERLNMTSDDIKLTPYTKSHTNIRIPEFLIILDMALFVWFYHCKMPVNA